MKRVLYVLLLVAAYAKAEDVHHHHYGSTNYPLVVPIENQEPDYYSRQWLYEFAQEHPGFAYTNKIQKNLRYYIELVRNHVTRLQGKVAQGTQSTANKRTKGASLTALGAVMAAGGIGLFKLVNDDPKKGIATGLLTALGMVSATVSVVPLILGPKALYKSLNYPDRLQKRLERAKRILAELEKAQAA